MAEENERMTFARTTTLTMQKREQKAKQKTEAAPIGIPGLKKKNMEKSEPKAIRKITTLCRLFNKCVLSFQGHFFLIS